MCWNTNINVVLQRDTPTARASVTQPTGSAWTPLVLEGSYPSYWVTNGWCGCGSVNEPDGRSLPHQTMAYLQHFLSVPAVKRVEVQWWWGDLSNRPAAAAEERLSLTDFERHNAGNLLLAGTKYRINNPPAFAGRKG